MSASLLRRSGRSAKRSILAFENVICTPAASEAAAEEACNLPSYRYMRTGPPLWAAASLSDDRCRGSATALGWAGTTQQPRRGFTSSSDGGSGQPAPHDSVHVHGATESQALPAGPATAAPPAWLRRLPASWAPYAQLSRLDKPIGTWLLAWPCFWSIALAAPPGSPPDAALLALFGGGAVLLRGAGCTINDLWDRELDRRVERTRHRPLAAGTLAPRQAIGWLAAQLGAGLGVLLQLNPYSQALGASSLVLVATYPLMKRITGWPQAFLGLTFNWGALLGWAAARGGCEWGVVLPLYLSGVCWTLVYDTIYAHQDKADDVAAGVKSTALTFGPHSRRYLAGFAAGSVALAAAAGEAAGCGAPFYAGLAAGAAHLAWQVGSVHLDDPGDCGAKFRSSGWYGAALFAGIAADRLLGVGHSVA